MTGLEILLSLCLAGLEPESPHFDTQVLPVLTKSGCNSGACHGAAAGRGGFALSLLGSNPAKDYDSIVLALKGRRIHKTQPGKSLVLLKPSGKLEHGGDLALPEDSSGYRLLESWIANGAKRGNPKPLVEWTIRATPSVIAPNQAPIQIKTLIQIKAMARFEQGPEIDVTQWTTFTISDPSPFVLNEDDQGTQIHLKRRGQHILLARFLDRVQPVTVIWPWTDSDPGLSQEPRANLVDAEIVKKLETLRIPVSPQASDGAFLRRIRLDLTGRLPTPAELDSYQKDTSKRKKEDLVDRLLASPEFTQYWTLRLARMLQLHSLPNEPEGMQASVSWLSNALKENWPLDRMTRELLLTTGDSHKNGAAYFTRMAQDARGQAELVSRVFMGTRLACANCHNHPLDRWTQDDYHGLAAIFAGMERGRIVKTGTRGGVTNPRTGEPATPRIPGVSNLDPKTDFREQFTKWLVSPDNAHFSKAMVNRIWASLFGRGLVDPVDDLRATNPATHPELLDQLAVHFAANGFQLKSTLRLIALSRTYGRSSQPLPHNAFDQQFYSHYPSRELDPEVLADAISDLTGGPQNYSGYPKGTRAISLYDPLVPAPSLDLLGRCSRGKGCEDSKMERGLAAQLHFLNGDLLNTRLTDPKGRLSQMLSSNPSTQEIVSQLFLVAFSRLPTEKEILHWNEKLNTTSSSERKVLMEDFLWALLNSREFTTNH